MHPIIRFAAVVAALLALGGLIAWMLLGIAHAAPAALSREQALSILAIATGLRGERLPETMPTIELLPRAALCREAGAPEACRLQGLTRDDDGRVLLDEAIDFADPWGASILLHELVHWLQWRARGAPATCAERLEREREAYALQAYVVDRAGGNGQPLRVAYSMLRCS